MTKSQILNKIRQQLPSVAQKMKNSVKIPAGVSRAEINSAIDKAVQEARKKLR